jgi:hypothetical protein
MEYNLLANITKCYNVVRGYPDILTFIMKPDPIKGLPMKHRRPFMQQLKKALFYLNKRLYLS